MSSRTRCSSARLPKGRCKRHRNQRNRLHTRARRRRHRHCPTYMLPAVPLPQDTSSTRSFALSLSSHSLVARAPKYRSLNNTIRGRLCWRAMRIDMALQKSSRRAAIDPAVCVQFPRPPTAKRRSSHPVRESGASGHARTFCGQCEKRDSAAADLKGATAHTDDGGTSLTGALPLRVAHSDRGRTSIANVHRTTSHVDGLVVSAAGRPV